MELSFVKSTSVFILLLLQAFGLSAQSSVVLSGRVLDGDIGYELVGASVTLMRGDSTVVDTARAEQREYINRAWTQMSKFGIAVPKEEGDYIFKVSYPGYDTLYVSYRMPGAAKRQSAIELAPFQMKRKARGLDEVVVRATKVKFYNKGGTLVYNADAFNLADGSMLDALIRQLPGVELKENGQIYVNGRFVENLLLNGKDFFKGNSRLILDNLGAYTVKDVAVYDKRGERSEFLGRDIAGDKEFVMDIRLKKEYSRGWIVNAEGGLGSRERYLGRVFAMGFTDNSRLTLYANLNNLNDTRKPGQSDGWNPGMMKTGVLKEKQAGFDYRVESPLHTRSARGQVVFEHSALDDWSASNTTNIFSQGNTCEQSFSSLRSGNYSLKTDHSLYTQHGRYNLTVAPDFAYRHYDNTSENLSASFTGELDLLDAGTLRDLLVSTDDSLRKRLINRSITGLSARGHETGGGLKASSTVKMPGGQDYATIEARASLGSDHSESLHDRRIDYARPSLSTEELRQRQRGHPNRRVGAGGSAGYTFVASRHLDMALTYGFDYSESKKNSALYILENTAGGFSALDVRSGVFDPSNSYASTERSYTHTVTPSLNFNKEYANGTLRLQLAAPFNIRHRTLRYTGSGTDTLVTHSSLTPSAYDTFANWTTSDRKHRFGMQYILTPKDPDMISLVDVSNTADPLNIYKGGNDLKSALSHSLVASWRMTLRPHSVYNSVLLTGDMTANALVNGYTFDNRTGVRTFRTYNVSGNSRLGVEEFFSFSFGRGGCLSLESTTGFDAVNSASMIGEDVREPSKQSVRNRLVSQTLRLEWGFSGQKIGLVGSGLWRSAKSRYEGFADFNSSDLKAGLTGLFKLPLGFQISTDCTLYARSGYSGAEMNKSSLVWNGRLSYTAFKGMFIFMLDGFDMLHQLKNVNYAVNAQGITESYSSVMPRYVLLHVQYRLNIKPKKRI